MIKLLMVTHNYPRFEGDFAGIFIALLAKRLPAFGIHPVILAPHAPQAAEFEEAEDVKVYRFRYADRDEDENLAYHGDMHKLVLGSVSGIFRFKHFLNCFRQAAHDVIEKESIDAIAGHWLVPSGLVIKPVNKTRNLPTFMYSHGTDVRLAGKYAAVAYRYLKDFCLGLKRWTVVSSFLRDQMVAIDPRLAEIIEVLPIPHDENTFFADAGIERDDDLVVSVTRFTQQKRVDYLIRAFELVVEQRPQARLHLYGGGPLRQDMEWLIGRRRLGGKVTIFDPVPQAELRKVYNRASVVVLNSVGEGFGLALSEAMLCGTAVVGAESGGIVDIIESEERGLLVKPDDVKELAAALIRILQDRPLRDRLAAAGHEFAVRNYTSAALALRYADIIKQGIS